MIVDSSVWIEIIGNGPLGLKCKKLIESEVIVIPSLVIFEVYKILKSRHSAKAAMDAIASLSRHEVLNLGREVALIAANLSLAHELPMADSLVLAHAVFTGDKLMTLDNDFAGLENVIIVRK